MKTEKFFDKKEKRERWRARFEMNGKTFRPTADSKKQLGEIVDEIRAREHRSKRNLDTVSPGPALRELLAKILSTIENAHRRSFCDRVFNNFSRLLPEDFRVKQLKKSHYQIYIDWRAPQTGKQSKKQIRLDTVYKELWAISGALKKGELYWDELEDWQKPSLPDRADKNRIKKESRRTKIVSPEKELYVLLAHLRKPKSGRQTDYTEMHRRRLADDLEFRYETGLRRKEVARLKLNQYFPDEPALRNVKRWKTGTITKYYPLSQRAAALIENRIKLMNGSDYVFTSGGDPVESDYRTLKTVCAELEIPYGIYTEDGFIPHDLRHNFASEIIQHGDIETARELLGHSNVRQTGDYLHTDESRLRKAVRKREGIDMKRELIVIYKSVRRGKMKPKIFLEKLKKLTDF